MRTTDIPLKHPVTISGHTYESLTMRSAKARDQVVAQKSASHKADVEVVLFSNLCEVSPEVLEELEMVDYHAVQKAYNGFLS